MRASMTVSKRLALGFGVLVVLMMASAAFAWTALRSSDAALKTMYEDRVIALVLLDDVDSLPVRNRVILMDAAMREDADVTAKHLDEFEKNRIEAAKAWKDYMATYLTPEEADLAKKAVAAAQPYDDEALAPMAAALRSGDYQEARRLAATKVSKLAPAMVEATHDLIKLQLRVAKQIYSESTVANERSLLAIVALGLFANGAAVIATFLITRKIVGQLGAEPHELAEVAGRVAGGDLTSSNRGRGGLTEGSVMAAMETMRQTLNDLVLRVRHGVDSVSTASGQIAQGNRDLSSRTEQQAASLQETAASMEQLSSTIQSTAGNAQNAQRMAQSASETAKTTGESMGTVVNTFSGIQEASRRISDIIGVIDSIAFQTNILALNAAVEAARAGEQGRGFAVVASEVRLLAQRSAEAARQIKQLITESGARIDDGSVLIGAVEQRINAVVNEVQGVSALIAQIAIEANEQTSGVNQIDIALQQLDTTTQQNAALVEEAAAAADSLAQQASALSEAVSTFRTEGRSTAAFA